VHRWGCYDKCVIHVRQYGLFYTVAVLSALVIFLVPVLFVRLATTRFFYTTPTQVPQTKVAIVLGASVARGMPSRVLADRADEAVALYLKGKVSKILVTGDNGALSHDEVTPVRKYLLQSGIPAQDIFLDHAGFDTYSSMYRARAVFDVQTAVIVTQDFHMPRALYVARMLGIEAVGIVTPENRIQMFPYLREIPASWKALGDLLIKRQPKYLGPVIPISGDGEVTWY